MILNLKKTDLLTTELPRFNFSDPPVDPIQLAQDLLDTMVENDGVGLAANQCGLPHRVFVMKGIPSLAFFNPNIVDVSSKLVVLEEGCLSYPNLFVKIKRPDLVKVRFTNQLGEIETKSFSGMSARIIQHEMDHLEGILFWERASRIHRERAFKNKKLYDRRAKRVKKN